jgi:hypothetical protein
MSEETKNLLLEVTGDSQPNCKKVMDALVHAMVKQGVGAGHVEQEKRSDGEDQTVDQSVVKPHLLQVEPVRVVDADAKLYVVYPSRVDLIFDDINVVRDS